MLLINGENQNDLLNSSIRFTHKNNHAMVNVKKMKFAKHQNPKHSLKCDMDTQKGL